ncbi:MAG TPA: nitroreductase family protein [archaeon]|nr:nitroreductase family protein [archaeon]
MYVFDAIMSRRSIYKFEKTPVDDRLIGVILYMGTQAPSAGNIQEWKFVVVREEKRKKELAKAALTQNFIADAPVVIVVCADLARVSLKYGKRGEVLYAAQDTALAIGNMMLAAQGLGLGSCFVGSFEEDTVSRIVELPDNIRPMAIILVGYPAEKPESPGRLPFENISFAEAYDKKIKLANFQPGAKVGESFFEPLSVYLEEAFKKVLQQREKEATKEKKKRLSFEEFLRKMVE